MTGLILGQFIKIIKSSIKREINIEETLKLPDSRLTLGVFVVETRGHTFKDCPWGEVLAGDHLQSPNLPFLLLLDDGVDLRVDALDRLVQGPLILAVGGTVHADSCRHCSARYKGSCRCKWRDETRTWQNSVLFSKRQENNLWGDLLLSGRALEIRMLPLSSLATKWTSFQLEEKQETGKDERWPKT